MITRCTRSQAYSIPSFLLPSFQQPPPSTSKYSSSTLVSLSKAPSRKGKERAESQEESLGEWMEAKGRLVQERRASSVSFSRRSYTTSAPATLVPTSSRQLRESWVVRKRNLMTAAATVRAVDGRVERIRDPVRQAEQDERELSAIESQSSETRDLPPISDFSLLHPQIGSSRPSRSDLLHLFATPSPQLSDIKHLHSLRKAVLHAERRDDLVIVTELTRLAISRREFTCNRFATKFLFECTEAIIQRHRGRITPGLVHLYEAVLNQLVPLEEWDWVRRVSGRALRRGIVSRTIIAARGRSCYETKEYEKGIEAFSLYAQNGLKPYASTYDGLVGCYLFNREFLKAQQVLAEKEAQGHKITAQTVLTILDGMFLYGGNEAMENQVLKNASRSELLKGKAPRQDVKVLNRIMSVRAARGDLAGALQVLPYFDLSDIPTSFDLPTFPNARPLRSLNLGNPPYPKFPSPNIATFATLMGVCTRARRTDCALNLFVQSQELGFDLNEYVVAALLRALIVNDRHDDAVDMVLKLAKGTATLLLPSASAIPLAAFVPTALIYEVLLAGILELDGLPGAIDFLDRVLLDRELAEATDVAGGMVTAFVAHLVRTTSSSTSSELRRENLKTIRAVQAAVNSKRVSVKHVNALLRFVWRKQKSSQERALHYKGQHAPLPTPAESLRVVDDLTSQYIQPTYRPFLAVIRSYFRAGDLDGAQQVIQLAKEAGVEPHVAMYSVLIAGLARRSRFDLARKTYEDMRASGIEPDRPLLTTLAIAFSRARDTAGIDLVWHEAMQSDDAVTELDPFFVLVYYRALVASKGVRPGQAFLRKRLRQGLVPDKSLLSLLIRARRRVKWQLGKAAAVRGTSTIHWRITLKDVLANITTVRSRLEREHRKVVAMSPALRGRVVSTLAKRRTLRRMGFP